MNKPSHLTGATIVRLMRANGRTIAGIAMACNITQKRVREVREHGVKEWGMVCDWLHIITGDDRVWDSPAASWAHIAKAYQ